MEASVEPGDDFYVASLDTPAGPVQTGVMICYDREFPESARILMLKGAELILTPNACGLDYFRLTQFQIRAWENSLATAMANYAEGPGNGRSCAFNADGKEILTAPADEEGIFIAEIDVPKIQKIRERTFWGNAFRRPHKYELLLSPEVKEPFIRDNAFDQPFERLKR
jgi:predicted amidohydrolase